VRVFLIVQFQTVYRSLSQNTAFPIVWYTKPTDRETSVSDHCEQEPDHRDVSYSLSHSNVMNSKEVDVKEEDDDDVLSSQIRNAGHEMFRGDDVQQTDDTERIYNSNTCEQMDRNSTSHETHTADKPHECDVCHKTFRDLGQLTGHKYVHGGIRWFTSDICNEAFVHSSDLTKHKRIHSRERPYVCDVCLMTFTDVSTLNKHKDVHTGIKQFTCDICNIAFTCHNDMSRHKLYMHSSTCWFVCEVCLLAFADVNALNIHKAAHFGITPFTCNICNVTFSCGNHLIAHMHIHSQVATCHL